MSAGLKLIGPSRQEERGDSFCTGSESRQGVFLLGSHREVSFARVCRGQEMWGSGVSLRIELGSLPMGNID